MKFFQKYSRKIFMILLKIFPKIRHNSIVFSPHFAIIIVPLEYTKVETYYGYKIE